MVSLISVWEAALLHQRGRLCLSMPLADWSSHSESLPLLRFVPVDNRIAAPPGPRVPGADKEQLVIPHDFDEPLPPDLLTAFER